MLVNATGPWGVRWLDRSGIPTQWPLLKAMNLVTSRPARKAALVGATRAGRALVLLPWQGRTLVGTSESADPGQPDDQDATRVEVDGFIDDVNDTFPALGLKVDEVTLVHRGIVPAAAANGRMSLLGQSRIIDHAKDGNAPELISIVGVKYTTARAVAERAVDLIVKKLRRSPIRCRTADTMLPEAGVNDGDPSDAVAHAISNEMALTLTDVVVRRTGLGALGHPGDAVANDVAGRMQQLLRWTEEHKRKELDALKAFYAIV